MSDRDDQKIVSLDQRRREDAARQKAELAAAAAAAKRKTNGPGRDLNQPFGRPMGSGAAPAPRRMGAVGLGTAVGKLLAGLVWGGLVLMIALAVWTSLAG